MSITNITFLLYADSGLTTSATTSLTVSAFNDLSDGYHDYMFYFGSTDTLQKLQATSNPGVDQVVFSPSYILPARTNSTAYSLGASVIPATANGYRYVCTTAGTTGSTVPTFGTTIGGTTTDGTVVWTLIAATSSINEIKLSLTSAGLAAATAGASLPIGNSLLSGPSNAIQFYMRVTNAVTTISNSSATPELGLSLNAVVQSAQ